VSTTTVDAEQLLQRCMGQVAIVERVLAQFGESAEDMLLQVEMGLERGDWEEVSRAAHSLKGAAAGISDESLRAAAARVEALARQRQAKACREDALPALRDELRLCLESIPAVVAAVTIS